MNGSGVATENPVFSPQGDAIAYDEPGPNSQDVFTFTLDFSNGSGQTNTITDVSPNFATDEAPSWGPVFPGASTPEVPQSVLLPVAGAGMFAVAGAVSVRRRRRREGAPTTPRPAAGGISPS